MSRSRALAFTFAALTCLAPIAPAAGCALFEEPATPDASPRPRPAARADGLMVLRVGETRYLETESIVGDPTGPRFRAPRGWGITRLQAGYRLRSSDGDVTMFLVAVDGEPDEVEAVTVAWRRVESAFARKVASSDRADEPPPGWDAEAVVTYRSPLERFVHGAARRKGFTQFVTLVDAGLADLELSIELVRAVGASWQPAPLPDETLAGRVAAPFDAARQETFARFVEQAMARARVPGAAVAVVQHGKVVFEQGFGAREAGKPEPVTADTLFLLGPNAMPLTSLVMAKLVDEGVIAWDTPVTELLPGFALPDVAATKAARLRDTMCACLPFDEGEYDALFEYGGATPERRLAGAARLVPRAGDAPRGPAQTQNLLASIGGYAAARAAVKQGALSAAWATTLRSRLLEPLGMTRTTVDFAAATKAEHATPHALDLAMTPTPFDPRREAFWGALEPAGGAWSTARDLAQVIVLELANGRAPSGAVVISEANLLERRVVRRESTAPDAPSGAGYGLGLGVEPTRGARVFHHGGNTLGFTSDVFFMPDHGLGAVVLANVANAGAFTRVVRRALLEATLGARPEAELGLRFALAPVERAYANLRERTTKTPDAAWIASVAGTYRDPRLGEVTLRSEGGRLVFDAGEWSSAAGRAVRRDGGDAVVLLEPPLAGVAFEQRVEGGKPSLEITRGAVTYRLVKTPKGSKSGRRKR